MIVTLLLVGDLDNPVATVTIVVRSVLHRLERCELERRKSVRVQRKSLDQRESKLRKERPYPWCKYNTGHGTGMTRVCFRRTVLILHLNALPELAATRQCP